MRACVILDLAYPPSPTLKHQREPESFKTKTVGIEAFYQRGVKVGAIMTCKGNVQAHSRAGHGGDALPEGRVHKLRRDDAQAQGLP